MALITLSRISGQLFPPKRRDNPVSQQKHRLKQRLGTRRPACSMRHMGSIRALEISGGKQWKVEPGNQILVIDNGAVRFDFPKDWTVYSGPDYVYLLDRVPGYSCVLSVSARLVPAAVAAIPLSLYMKEIIRMDDTAAKH